MDLSYNWGLAGPLPSSLDLSRLERLDVFATRACAPPAWLSWLGAIDFTGALCGADADVIDVAVFHTAAARVAAGEPDGIDALIDLYIAETNRAFEESGVRTRVALVAREEVDYTETDEYDKDIDRLRNPSDGHLDGVHAVRDRVGADLVHLIVAELDVCGVAELGGAFGITRHGCGGRTFAHELGHNLGETRVSRNAAHSLDPAQACGKGQGGRDVAKLKVVVVGRNLPRRAASPGAARHCPPASRSSRRAPPRMPGIA